jgi:hypothetical protein
VLLRVETLAHDISRIRKMFSERCQPSIVTIGIRCLRSLTLPVFAGNLQAHDFLRPDCVNPLNVASG